jgi:hypothetical protein
MKYTVESTHAEVLADGKLVNPNEEVTLTKKAAEEDHNARLIDEGRLMPVNSTEDKEDEQ